MRTKTMLARAKKKSKRREGRKMAVVREPEPFEVTHDRTMRRLHRIAGPNASPLDLVLAIQASARAEKEWEQENEPWD
jgi:hypothetical protein